VFRNDRVPYSDEEMSDFQGYWTSEDQEELLHMAQLIKQNPICNEINDYCNSWASKDVFRGENESLVYEEEAYKSNSLLSTPMDRVSPYPKNITHKINAAVWEGDFWDDERMRRLRCAHNTEEGECDPKTMRATKEKERPNINILSKSSRKISNTAEDDDRKIFLGGLPLGINERTLRQEMAAQGYKVLRRPKIIRGFAPEVMMRSVEEAKELVDKGVINILGVEAEVRSFNSYNKRSKSKKIPNIERRSVFLGGLSQGTKVKDILGAMKKLNLRVVNYPVIKFGFSPQVIFQTVSQAQQLIKLKKVVVNGKLVDVRPFTRQHFRKKLH